MEILRRFLMGRPATIRLADGGIIILKNCAPGTADKIRAALEPSGEVVVATIAPSPAPVETKPTVPTGVMTETAIGVYQDKTTLSHYVAQVKYNPYTQSASVIKVENCGSVEVATEKFKVLAVKNNLV